VVVLTRDDALPRLRNVVVALVTRTVRGIETEVPIGPTDGMPVECAISLDNLRTVPRVLLTERITQARWGEDGGRLPGTGLLGRMLITGSREMHE
jgi:mRNA-degrading endonuclease toxin of MazEF toxin-antitoxin module